MSGRTPLYRKLYTELHDTISSGALRPGDKLPTEQQLQDSYGVSRHTVRMALAKLENEGLIEKRPPLGSFVRQDKSDYELSRMTSFSEQMRARNMVPSSDLESIELARSTPDTIRTVLRLKPDERCYVIRRTRLANGTPMAYEVAYVPSSLCPDIQRHISEDTSLFEVYQEVYGLRIGTANIKLEALEATSVERDRLGLPEHAPVLKMECLCHLKDGGPLYYVECAYDGTKYFFSTKAARD